jgi:HK97 family phage major capsid protein
MAKAGWCNQKIRIHNQRGKKAACGRKRRTRTAALTSDAGPGTPGISSRGIQMNLQEMKQEQKAALDKATAIVSACEIAGRAMTLNETTDYNTAMAAFRDLGATAKAREEQNTIRAVWPKGSFPGITTPSGAAPADAQLSVSPLLLAEARKPEYATALHGFLKSGGKALTQELLPGGDGFGGFHIPGSEAYTRQRNANGSISRMQAATYEGTEGSSDAAGGYAVSVPTEQLIVPLGMPDLGIFDASFVMPTLTDVKIPQQVSFGTSALKAESTGTIATFGGTDPTLGQTALTAFMVGAARVVSWELLQDVAVWNQFVVEDLLKGQRIFEGSLLASGTGSSQPLGVFGNTGTGTGSAYELLGTSADSTTLLNSLFDVTSTLKGAYQANASWIMSRATGLAIRKAQMQTNLFAPVATVDADGTERILGHVVNYDVNAPALPTATSAGVIPILYGDFKQGYIIGVRGGAGINVKILDQPLATQGQLVIMAYRRLDARIRQSEAIQQIKISHS